MAYQRPVGGWVKVVLLLAAVYNVAWGGFMILWPLAFFDWIGMPRPNYPALWQCIGMMVGVFGVGYGFAASDPVRYWPIVLVGLLGKILGPVGFLNAALHGDLPWVFGWTLVTNDVIWWVPFALILYRVSRQGR